MEIKLTKPESLKVVKYKWRRHRMQILWRESSPTIYYLEEERKAFYFHQDSPYSFMVSVTQDIGKVIIAPQYGVSEKDQEIVRKFFPHTIFPQP